MRSGRSDLRVSSGAVSQSASAQGAGAAGAGQAPGAGLPGQTINPIGLSAVNQATNDASRVSTISQSDFWNDLVVTLKALVGTAPGRKVIVNPQAGIVIVHAMPGEIRDVEKYLKAMRLAVERQVMIEAKIIEVTLNRDYQAGVNWAAFSGRGLSVGQVSRGTLLARIDRLDNAVVEVRSPLPGRISRISIADGTTVHSDNTILTIDSDAGSVWEALRGLALIGEAKDLSEVERYVRGVDSLPDQIKGQAALTAKAIQSRKP